MQSGNGASNGRQSTSTSRSLLHDLRANNPGAWNRLVHLYSPLVWQWCRKMQVPAQDIADVFQEVFQAVAGHLDRFRSDRPGDTFRGWLRTITQNKIHDHFRRRQHEPQAAGGTEAKAWWSRVAEAPDSEMETVESSAEDNLLFHRALEMIEGEFEPSTWRAFWRVVVDGQSPHDVASELGTSAGAVRVAKCRVLHRLRQELGDVPS